MTNKLVSKQELEIGLVMRSTWELKDLFNLIDRMPLVDGGFTCHGHWDETPTGWIYCSRCGAEPPEETNFRSEYCPHCGAKMDEEVEDERNI